MFPFRTNRFLFWSLFIFFFARWVCFAENPPQRWDLKVVALKNFPPQYSMSETGPQGFAVDVIREIADIAAVDIQFIVKDSWAEAFDALHKGEVDLIPNQGITEKRKKWFAFSSPVETFSVRFFVRESSKEIHSLDELNNQKVGVVRLNIAESLLAGNKNITMISYDHAEEALFNLLSGNLDAMVFPEPVLRLMARNAGIEDRIKSVGPPLTEIKRAISVQKDNEKLLARLNIAVEKFVGSPAYEKIYTRWYGEPTPWFTIKKLIFLTSTVFIIVIFSMGLWRYRSLKAARDQLDELVRERTSDLVLANEKLADSQQQLRDIIEFLPDPTWVVDVKGRVIIWNRAIEKMTGLPKENILGKGGYAHSVPLYGEKRPVLIDLVIERDKDWENGYMNLESRGDTLVSAESYHPFIGEDGRYLAATAAKLYDTDGRVMGAIETIRDITDAKHKEREREKLINELRNAFDEISTLSGLLPICASCKKIRDDKGYWNQIESYIQEHSEATFSHGMCPECSDNLYGDKDWYIKMKDKKNK